MTKSRKTKIIQEMKAQVSSGIRATGRLHLGNYLGDEKSEKKIKDQKGGTYLYKGHRSPTSGKEKAVDVHLAVDIVKHTFRKECNRIVIMTGDADLVYPLEIAKQLGASVHAIFLPNRFSLGIAFLADTAAVLNYFGKFRFKKGKKKLRKLRVLEMS